RRTAGEISVIDGGQIGIALLIRCSGRAARGHRCAVIRPQAEEHLHVEKAVHRAAPGFHPALYVIHCEFGVVLDVPGIRSGLPFDHRAGNPIDPRRLWARNTRPTATTAATTATTGAALLGSTFANRPGRRITVGAIRAD